MMDALPMDDEPPCADCTEAEDVDHLNQLAHVAAGAALVAALKRRAESKAGMDICWVASARLAAHGATAAASWWAEAPHFRGSGLYASAISSSQNRMWLQHRPERTTRRTADGSRTAQIASHGRLTACRSRLMRYPDRADDRRASLFLRRGALCILACVVPGILCA
eukprot:jgi/Chrpa1/13598/Chrysochromulina_OHIO_Genome00022387-RA